MDADARVVTIGGVQVVTPRIHAKMDPFGDNVSEFEELARPLVDAAGSRVVIDLESSTACDGLVSASMMLHTRARASGSRVVFARPDARLRLELHICKLDGVIEIFPSLESAILSLDPEAIRMHVPPKAPS